MVLLLGVTARAWATPPCTDTFSVRFSAVDEEGHRVEVIGVEIAEVRPGRRGLEVGPFEAALPDQMCHQPMLFGGQGDATWSATLSYASLKPDVPAYALRLVGYRPQPSRPVTVLLPIHDGVDHHFMPFGGDALHFVFPEEAPVGSAAVTVSVRRQAAIRHGVRTLTLSARAAHRGRRLERVHWIANIRLERRDGPEIHVKLSDLLIADALVVDDLGRIGTRRVRVRAR